MSSVVERVRNRFAEQIITLLLADLKEHGTVLDRLPDVRPEPEPDLPCVWCGGAREGHGPDRLCPGTTSSFYTTDSKISSREQQLRERWLQIFDGYYKKRDLRAAEMRSEQSRVDARMIMGLCLMEVFLALDGVAPDTKKSFSIVFQNPDGTATLNSMFDADLFLQDLRTILDVPPEFDAKKVAENVLKFGDMSSLRTLGLLGVLCQDQIQEALGLPRDPITAEAVETLLLLRREKEASDT